MTSHSEQLDLLLAKLLDESLDETERAALAELLSSEPAARQAYLEVMLTHAALQAELGPQVPAAPVSADNEVDAQDEVAAQAKGRSPLLGFLDNLPQAIQPALHPVRFIGLAAALTGLFWVLAVLLIWPHRVAEPGHNQLAQQLPLPFTAKIIQLKQVVWSKETKSIPLGSELAPGAELEWKSGLVQILFGDGTRAIVEGPASLRIENRDNLRLKSGRFLARVPVAARGFLAKTPFADVVDLGTEFGIDISETEAKVQVFEGNVRASRPGDLKNSSRVLSAGQAVAFGFSSQGIFYAKEMKMNRSLYLTMIAALAVPIAGPVDATLQAATIPVLNATASAQLDTNFGPINTINGSGLNGLGQHSNSNNAMWIGDFTSIGHHITFELPNPYTIESVHIWNGNYWNGLNRSVQEVQILVSPDNNPANLVALENPGGPNSNFLFTNGDGENTYAGFDLDLSGVSNNELLEQVSLVRFVVKSTYGNANFPTLSEVQYFGSLYVAPPAPAPEPSTGMLIPGAIFLYGLKRGKKKRLALAKKS